MRLFIYRRIGSYHEETYSVLSDSEEEAQQFVDSYTEFELEPEDLKRVEITEVDLNKKGISYINSYSE